MQCYIIDSTIYDLEKYEWHYEDTQAGVDTYHIRANDGTIFHVKFDRKRECIMNIYCSITEEEKEEFVNNLVKEDKINFVACLFPEMLDK
jgi:hypothetical protein